MARIQISNDPSGRIIVSFPYDPLLVEKAKSIDGRRWHSVEKHWSFPKLNGMLEKIFKVFEHEDVQIDPSLWAKLPTLKETVPDFVMSTQSKDLQTDNHSIPPLEKGGKGGFESGLSPKFAFEDLRSVTDLQYIQEFLGPFHSKTTEIYTHVSTKSIGKIKSPLDTLTLKKGGDG